MCQNRNQKLLLSTKKVLRSTKKVLPSNKKVSLKPKKLATKVQNFQPKHLKIRQLAIAVAVVVYYPDRSPEFEKFSNNCLSSRYFEFILLKIATYRKDSR